MLGNSFSVSYIMETKLPFLEPSFKVTRAREIFRVTGARILPVLDDKYSRRLLGVVSRAEMLGVSSTKSELRVRDIMTQPLITLDESVGIYEAARLMLEKDEWYAPVTRGVEYQGMLGLEDIIAWLLYRLGGESSGNRSPMPAVADVMTREVVHVAPQDPISKVWYLMLKHKYAGLPVVDKSARVVGVITQYDLLKKGRARLRLESESDPTRVTVKEVMSRPAITVRPSASLAEAGSIMVRRNIGRLVVADESGRLLGIVDRSDVLRGLLRWLP